MQTKGQYPIRDVANAFVAIFLFSRHLYGATFANALSF